MLTSTVSPVVSDIAKALNIIQDVCKTVIGDLKTLKPTPDSKDYKIVQGFVLAFTIIQEVCGVVTSILQNLLSPQSAFSALVARWPQDVPDEGEGTDSIGDTGECYATGGDICELFNSIPILKFLCHTIFHPKSFVLTKLPSSVVTGIIGFLKILQQIIGMVIQVLEHMKGVFDEHDKTVKEESMEELPQRAPKTRMHRARMLTNAPR